MKHERRHYVFLGLSITSTWGNGHATTYRGLLKELAHRGHQVTFLERDVPWYASNREFDQLPYCAVKLYEGLQELEDRYSEMVRGADAVVVGSYVPQGIAVGRWVQATATGLKAFYDIDTPVTLANLRSNSCEYLSRELIPGYDLYLSFTGGPTLDFIECKLGSPCARPLYCSVDPSLYYPEPQQIRWNMAYLGTYAADRQPTLKKLVIDAARKHPEQSFAVAGPQYPADIEWPPNVERIEHLPAADHRRFYNSQAFTLNVTRRDMILAGYSPSVRLFEAAACGVPILTDCWPGLEGFFRPGSEILAVPNSQDITSYLQMPEEERAGIAHRARCRTLQQHTSAARAQELDRYVVASLEARSYSKKQRTALISEPAPALS